jgi:hypothetical protein
MSIPPFIPATWRLADNVRIKPLLGLYFLRLRCFTSENFENTAQLELAESRLEVLFEEELCSMVLNCLLTQKRNGKAEKIDIINSNLLE